MARILIAGCGYVGTELGLRLAAERHVVWGLRRKPSGLPELIRPVEGDLSVPSSLGAVPTDLDFVVYAVAPGGPDDLLYKAAFVDGLRNLLGVMRERNARPSRIVFVSTTGVYGQANGEWVDEGTPEEPADYRGRRALEGERLLQESGHPYTVVRFGGIYGPRRTGLLERVRTGRAVYREDPPHYTNRIHLADCAGVLRHVLALPDPATLYLGVDSEPVEERTVMTWLAGALGAPPPRAAASGEESGEPRGNKRCRNERLVASGYAFAYPSFREGYRALIETLASRPPA
jgi:nucleoside-diphosphate-sugar epimerase